MTLEADLSMNTNPCFECGMCCQHFRVSFYHGEIAGNGIGIVPAELTSKVNAHIACMKGTEKGGEPCIALKHTEEEGWRCSIYEQRPSSCREFNILNEDGTMNQKCQELQQVAKQRRQHANS
jgi:Fe-S-cluster containining protein